MKLTLQQFYLTWLKNVQDQQDKVSIPSHREDSSPPPSSRGSNLRLRIRQTIEDSRLANAGETDQDNSGVSAFANLKSWTPTLRGGSFELRPYSGELRLQ